MLVAILGGADDVGDVDHDGLVIVIDGIVDGGHRDGKAGGTSSDGDLGTRSGVIVPAGRRTAVSQVNDDVGGQRFGEGGGDGGHTAGFGDVGVVDREADRRTSGADGHLAVHQIGGIVGGGIGEGEHAVAFIQQLGAGWTGLREQVDHRLAARYGACRHGEVQVGQHIGQRAGDGTGGEADQHHGAGGTGVGYQGPTGVAGDEVPVGDRIQGQDGRIVAGRHADTGQAVAGTLREVEQFDIQRDADCFTGRTDDVLRDRDAVTRLLRGHVIVDDRGGNLLFAILVGATSHIGDVDDDRFIVVVQRVVDGGDGHGAAGGSRGDGDLGTRSGVVISAGSRPAVSQIDDNIGGGRFREGGGDGGHTAVLGDVGVVDCQGDGRRAAGDGDAAVDFIVVGRGGSGYEDQVAIVFVQQLGEGSGHLGNQVQGRRATGGCGGDIELEIHQVVDELYSDGRGSESDHHDATGEARVGHYRPTGIGRDEVPIAHAGGCQHGIVVFDDQANSCQAVGLLQVDDAIDLDRYADRATGCAGDRTDAELRIGTAGDRQGDDTAGNRRDCVDWQ